MTAAATGRELGMKSKSTALEISAICAFFILIALWGVVYDITSGLLTSGIDGIMLLIVSATMAGVFFLILLAELNRSGILPTPKFLRAEPKPAAAVKPAAAAAPKPPAATAPAAPAASATPAAPAKPAAPTAAPAAPPAEKNE